MLVLLLLVVWAIASIPMFMTYLPITDGHDILFHLYRIQGIADGLRNGQFPVRMQYVQLDGYGYPVSIMYGDIFLYPSAILHILGLSVNTAYKLFVLVLNLLTVVTTFVLVKRVFKSDFVAFVGAALWTLAPYRLEDVYLRAAVGEYTALFFFPILLYGWYAIVYPGLSKHPWIWTSIGASGIVLSHVISVVLVAVPMVVLVVVGIRVNCTKTMWKQLALSAVCSAGLCLWYVVPFWDYYRSVDMKVTQIDAAEKVGSAAANAVQPAQLLMFLVPMRGGSDGDVNRISQDMPFALGWSLLCGLVVFAALIALRKAVCGNQQKRMLDVGGIMVAASMVALYCSMTVFYWRMNRFALWNKLIAVLSSIQFPWRFLGVASALLVVVSCAAIYCLLLNKDFAIWGRRAGALMVIIAACEAGFATTSWMQNSISSSPFSDTVDNHAASYGVMSGEYLPAGFDVAYLDRHSAVPTSTKVSIGQYIQRDGTVDLTVSASSRGTVTLPLLMYPYYHAVTKSGDELMLTASRNGMMQLHVPNGYKGTVHIAYTEPLVWRLSEVVSACAVGGLLMYGVWARREFCEWHRHKPRSEVVTR
ncbi:hypothetical protein [Bifidobacterium saguinibicoloris]|uniref:hypothetical protein n=1 Tax=Bifidobacterium saguinibicoloris TaxID=2834433 RepID=UPI001C59A852|nr:hypothetical protein [Bifidobacterium saguinibicoloris]